MIKGDSPRAGRGHRPSGEKLWNAAAVGGLLLLGLVIGGVVGVVLDRQGLLGGAAQQPVVAALEEPELPLVSPPVEPRVLKSAAAFDREALEAQYQQTQGAVAGTEPADLAAPVESAWQSDTGQGDTGQGDTGQGDSRTGSPPDAAMQGPSAWQRYAVAVAPGAGRPMIAILLDDVGVNRRGALQAIALPGPLTLSFMTYANDLPRMTAAARQAGHELMLHVPMQPQSDDLDPGPNVLRADLPTAELHQRLTWGLTRFEGYVGINNHMGSRFTASPEGMALVMQEVKARGLLFVDSMTAADSVAGSQAARAGVPYAVRDIFIDNEPDDPAAIHRQLALLEQAAREQGFAVGIGHPHDGTVAALRQWIPEMQARGFALVPISAIVRHRQRLAANGLAGAG